MIHETNNDKAMQIKTNAVYVTSFKLNYAIHFSDL